MPGTKGNGQIEVEVAGVHPKVDVEQIACQVCGSGDDDRRIVASSHRRRTVLLRPYYSADRDWLLTFLELFAFEPIADFSKTRIQFAKGSAPATST